VLVLLADACKTASAQQTQHAVYRFQQRVVTWAGSELSRLAKETFKPRKFVLVGTLAASANPVMRSHCTEGPA